MSYLNIPDVNASININRDDVVNLLLASIAFEELGLSHIINSEAEKIQYIIGTLPGQTPPEKATAEDLLKIDFAVQQVMKNVIEKEMILQFKLEDILLISSTTTTTSSTTTTTSSTTTTTSSTTTTTSSTTTTTSSTTTTTSSTTTTTSSTTTTTSSTTTTTSSTTTTTSSTITTTSSTTTTTSSTTTTTSSTTTTTSSTTTTTSSTTTTTSSTTTTTSSTTTTTSSTTTTTSSTTTTTSSTTTTTSSTTTTTSSTTTTTSSTTTTTSSTTTTTSSTTTTTSSTTTTTSSTTTTTSSTTTTSTTSTSTTTTSGGGSAWAVGTPYGNGNAQYVTFAPADTDVTYVLGLGAGNIPIGNVRAVRSGNNLDVTFTVDNPYLMSAVHLYVGNTIPPFSAPGLFPYIYKADDPSQYFTTYTFTADITSFVGITIYIAAHADV